MLERSQEIFHKFLFFYVWCRSLLFINTVIYGKDGRISFTKAHYFTLHINCKYIIYDCGWMCSNYTLFCDGGIYLLHILYSYGEIIYCWFFLCMKQVHVKITTYKFDILLSLCIHFNLPTPWTCYVIIWGPANTAYHDVSVPPHINLNSYAFTNILHSQSVDSTVL